MKFEQIPANECNRKLTPCNPCGGTKNDRLSHRGALYAGGSRLVEGPVTGPESPTDPILTGR